MSENKVPVEQTEEKKKKKALLPIIIIAAVLLLGGAAAAFWAIGGTKKTPTPEDDMEITDDQLWWNIDRFKYAGLSEIGTSSRGVDPDDGYYHVLFASEGRQVTRRVAEKKVLNLVDSNDLMGLVFDEKGIIVGVKKVEDVTGGYEIKGWYIQEVLGDRKILLDSASKLDGVEEEWTVPEGVRIFDMSGNLNFIGAEIKCEDLQPKDRIFAVKNKEGVVNRIFITDRYVKVDVFWNVEKMWNAELLSTTRVPNADGEYEILLAVNGEQKIFKTKDKAIVDKMDKEAAKCFGLQFDYEGYINKFMQGHEATGGGVPASWAHVTSVNDNMFTTRKALANADYGSTAELMLTEDAGIYDVSGYGAFVGEKVDALKVGDQVHVLADANGNAAVVFIVGKLARVPYFWNVERKYDSTAKKTSRTRGADGLYHIKLASNGVEKEYVTDDEALATQVDSYAAKCMGLEVEGNVIKKYHTFRETAGGREVASWYDVVSMNGKSFHAEKIIKAADTGAKYDGVLADDVQVYNVSDNYINNFGEKTTLQVGDRIHAAEGIDGKITCVFVVSRPIQSEIYWNIYRKWDKATSQTTLKPDANGDYVYYMSVNGKTVTLRTKDKKIANSVDSMATHLMGLRLNGDVITKVYPTSTVLQTMGGVCGSWAHVQSFDGKKYVAKKIAQAADTGTISEGTLAPNCKIFNVGGLYTTFGEYTTLQVGDQIHAEMNKDKQVTYIYVVGRKAPDKTGFCNECGKEVTWVAASGAVSAQTDASGNPLAITHVYVPANMSLSVQATIPYKLDVVDGKNVYTKTSDVHLDLCGKALTAGSKARIFATFGGNANYTVFDSVKGGKLISAEGAQKDKGAAIWMMNTGKVTIKDCTIDLSAMDAQTSVGGIYSNMAGAEYNLSNVKIIGGYTSIGSVLRLYGNATLKDVTIEGGKADEKGTVYVANNAVLTLNGNTKVSGGTLTDGTKANIYLENGSKLDTTGLTCADGSIHVSTATRGAFTTANFAGLANKFVADKEGATITEKEGVLYINWPVEPGEHFHAETTKDQMAGATDEEKTFYSAWTKTTTLPASGYYYLTEDVNLAGVHYLGANADLHLCLNGHKIIGHDNDYRTISMFETGCHLSVCDCSDGETGCITGPKGTELVNNQGRVVWVRYGEFDLYGGTLIGTDTTAAKGGGAITIEPNSTFKMYGGTVKDGNASTSGGNINNNGNMYVYGGTIENGTAVGSGGNIYNAKNLYIYGGTIKGGVSALHGGNISSNYYVSMTDGLITGGKAGFVKNSAGSVEKAGGTATWMVGGNLNNEGTFIMNGGSMENGEANYGGNIYTYYKVTIEGKTAPVTIKNGKSTYTGGNLWIEKGASCDTTIKNAVISGGISGTSAKNIYMKGNSLVLDNVTTEGGTYGTYGDVQIDGGTITVKDSTIEGIVYIGGTGLTLDGKVNIANEKKDSLWIETPAVGETVTLGSSFDKDSKIYIASKSSGTVVKNGAEMIDSLTHKNGKDWVFDTDGDKLLLVKASELHKHCVCGTDDCEAEGHTCDKNVKWTAWTETGRMPRYDELTVGENYFYLAKDITLTDAWTPGKDKSGTVHEDMGGRNINICLNGHTIKSSAYRMITSLVYYDTTKTPSTKYATGLRITFTDCAETPGTVQITKTSGTDQGMFAWLMGTDSELNVYRITVDGSKVSCTKSGVLLNVGGNNVVNLYSGTLKGGSSTTTGGLATFAGTSVLNIYDAELLASTSKSYGAGLYLTGSSVTNMYGGKISGGKIDYGTSTWLIGGNVYMDGSATFNMKDGEISGGVATHGGNVGMENGSFNMEGGVIKDGSSTYAPKGANWSISTAGGGNVFINNGSFNMKDGEISGGSAKRYGGNIALNWTDASKHGRFTMEDGLVTKGYVNSSKAGVTYGGNIASKGEVTIKGGEISEGIADESITEANNGGVTAQGFGGNIAILGGSFNMTDGDVLNGFAAIEGGNVYFNPSVATNLITASITGGKISGGTVGWIGGGIFVYAIDRKTTLTIGGDVEITNNGCKYTTNYGNGIGIQGTKADITLTGTPVFGGNKNLASGVNVESDLHVIDGALVKVTNLNVANPVVVRFGAVADSKAATAGAFATADKDYTSSFKASGTNLKITYSGGTLSLTAK